MTKKEISTKNNRRSRIYPIGYTSKNKLRRLEIRGIGF